MLYVGVDWAEAQHAACLVDVGGRVLRRLTIPHTPVGMRRLREAITAAESEPAAVLVAIERPDGLLVDGLLAAGYVVYALNPKAVERFRERTRLSGGKTDPADAELLARILVTDPDRHQPLRPSSVAVEELRVLARQDETASRDETRLRNRLRQDLLAAFPAALDAFPDLAARSALRFLERWPTATEADALAEAELAAFLREQGHFRSDVAAARIHAALHADVLAAPAHLTDARAGAIRLGARQLLLLREQRAAWETRLRELLAGDRAHPDGEILLGLPGLDARLAVRVLGEIGDRRERFPTPAALQSYAGTAPVTKASGRARVVVVRTACNRFLRQALLRWAFCSLTTSGWARAYYDQHRQGGKTHYSALRILANRWLVIPHHLLATDQRYDEEIHQRNRAHASTDTAARPADPRPPTEKRADSLSAACSPFLPTSAYQPRRWWASRCLPCPAPVSTRFDIPQNSSHRGVDRGRLVPLVGVELRHVARRRPATDHAGDRSPPRLMPQHRESWALAL